MVKCVSHEHQKGKMNMNLTDEFISSLQKELRKFYKRLNVKDDELIKDLIQDTFCKFIQFTNSNEIEIENGNYKKSVKNFIFSISRNVLYDFIRKKNSRKRNGDHVSVEEIDSICFPSQEHSVDLMRALNIIQEMKKNNSDILLAMALGVSPTEISIEKNISVETVKDRRKRALNELKYKFERKSGG